jgi:hypothetical protein
VQGLAVAVLLAANAFAGGDDVLVKVAAFSGKSGRYRMHVVQTSTGPSLIGDCREFDLQVAYRRPRWFTWLPFFYSGNPSKKETNDAAAFLKFAQRTGTEIRFGYLGNGMVPDPGGKACSFLSWGLGQRRDAGDEVITLAYHDEI